MKNKIIGLCLAVSSIFILFSSCSKNDGAGQHIPSAGFMAFNLAVDQPAVGFALSGNLLSPVPIPFTGYTGNYLSIFTGTRQLRVYDFFNGITLSGGNYTYLDSSYYSAFFMGYNGAYRTELVQDDFSTVVPTAGKAWVRYVNAVADSNARPIVRIGAFSETLAYAGISAFMPVDAGNLTVSIENGTQFAVSRNIVVEENKIYTILFAGQPQHSNTDLAVQIRFIQNGTATP